MPKSHVSMGQNQCPVCLSLSDSGEVLLDRRLQDTLESKTVTGWGMCPKCQDLKNKGFTALVELQREPTRVENVLHVPRTGNIAHVKNEAWGHIFNIPLPEKGMAVVPVGVIEMIQSKVES